MADNIWRNETLFYEICEHSVHIFIGFGKLEFFRFFFMHNSFWRSVREGSYRLSQQFLHSRLKIHIIEFLHKFYCTASDLIFMVEPSRATERYAVVPARTVVVNELMLSADTFQLFTPHTQKLLQVYRICKDFLFVCKWDIWHNYTNL